MKRFTLLLLVMAVSLAAGGEASIEPLHLKQIAPLKKKSCTLIHVWATWCSICIDEMPGLLRMLSANKQIRPVIIDVSQPLSQKGFSVPWMQKLAPPFTTYTKPPGSDEKYLKAIDPEWSGALPYFAFYDKGRRKKVWVGEVKPASLQRELAELCQ